MSAIGLVTYDPLKDKSFALRALLSVGAVASAALIALAWAVTHTDPGDPE